MSARRRCRYEFRYYPTIDIKKMKDKEKEE